MEKLLWKFFEILEKFFKKIQNIKENFEEIAREVGRNFRNFFSVGAVLLLYLRCRA